MAELMTVFHLTLSVLANLIGQSRGVPPQRAILNTDHANLSCMAHFTVQINGEGFSTIWKAAQFTEMPMNPNIFYHIWSAHFVCKDERVITLYQKVGLLGSVDVRVVTESRISLVFLIPQWDPPADLLLMIGFPPSQIPYLLSLCDPKITTAAKRTEFQTTLINHIRSNWNAFDLEAHIHKTRIGAAMVPRSRKEFLESEQGGAVGWRPPLEFTRFDSGTWKPVPFAPLKEPKRGVLSGIKVVELTRALMGSRIGAVLGYLGATVVKATSPQMVCPYRSWLGTGLTMASWQADFGVLSASHNAGKLSIFLDLAKPEDKEKLRELIRDADVFVSNYALGALERLGFGHKDVFELIKGRERGLVFCEGNA